jgi:hypothetical protein
MSRWTSASPTDEIGSGAPAASCVAIPKISRLAVSVGRSGTARGRVRYKIFELKAERLIQHQANDWTSHKAECAAGRIQVEELD